MSTKDLEQHIYEDYLKTQWAERVAKNIEPLKIQEWLDSFKRELADTTRAKIRNVMSAIYRHGQKWGMIPRNEECNPMKWVSCSTISDYEAITVSPEEAFAIVECLPLFERTLLILVAVTAIRISEALGLRWSDILGAELGGLLLHERPPVRLDVTVLLVVPLLFIRGATVIGALIAPPVVPRDAVSPIVAGLKTRAANHRPDTP
jgi:hypothetical protein